MCKILLCALSILTTLSSSEAYKILIVSPTPSRSHNILNQGIIRLLTDAGHEITHITSVPQKSKARATEVDISDTYTASEEFLNIQNFMDNKFIFNETSGLLPLILDISRFSIQHPKVQAFMADESQEFDAVIAEFLFNRVYAGFSALYDCPMIWFSPTVPHWMVFELIDEATNPAYTVDAISISTPPLTFVERVRELSHFIARKLFQVTWSSGFDKNIYENDIAPFIRKRRNFVPSFESIAQNTSLVLSNYHTSMGTAVRAPQNYISIGGFHIDQNVQPLPEDLQRLMDSAKNGVIYFSMGSHMQSKHFPSQIKRDLLTMFSKLNQTVIWKFEEDMPNTPSNVHLIQWAPQQSILAHENCIIFITHGGILSTTETLHFGVPIIGIPGFYDQFVNIERSVKMGFARKVDLTYSIVRDLEIAIHDLLEDPKYTNKIHELSEIYHDRPVSPGKELVHWVEHVIKTRGAPHLRSPAFLMPWYQKIYLDLILVLLILIIALKYAFQYLRYTKIQLIVNKKQKTK